MAEQGNVAAMREALKYASRVLAKWQQDAPFSAWNEYGEAIDKCRASLSAPARNCDRYATWDKAWDAFSESYFGPTDPGEPEYHFGVWLFAKEETRP